VRFSLLRAFAWLHWRLAVNGLRGGRRRDALERVSRITQVAAPALLAAAVIPAGLAFAVLATWGGWALVSTSAGAQIVPLVAGLLLLAPLAWFAIRPLVRAGQEGPERGELLRLLPIPTRALRHLELLRAGTDPLFLVVAPGIVLLPAGSLLGGRPGVAVAALAAGLAFIALLLAVASLVGVASQLLLRDRRRAELATLLFFLLLSISGLLPQLFAPHRHRLPDERRPPAAATGDRNAQRAPANAAPESLPVAIRVLPSGLYAAALEGAAAGSGVRASADVAILAALAVLAYAAGAPLHRRLLDTPEAATGTRTPRAARMASFRLAGVSPAVAAVALLQVRVVTRTTRGRMLLISSTFASALFGFVFTRDPASTPALLAQPYTLAGMAVLIALSNLSAVSWNQFATDASGLPLEFLAPIEDRQLVAGKAIGGTILLCVTLAPALVVLALVCRPAPVALWPAAFLGGLAAFAALAPVAAMISAILPRTADLSRLGSASQPHSGATILALLSQGLALVPTAGIIALAWLVLGNPWLAPLLTALWAGVALLVCRLLVPVAGRVLAARRENLALVAAGR
jgi:hypothetical protein